MNDRGTRRGNDALVNEDFLPLPPALVLAVTTRKKSRRSLTAFTAGSRGTIPVGQRGSSWRRCARHPQWKLCLEIEPATWQSERICRCGCLSRLQAVACRFPGPRRVRFRRSWQSYFWNVDGESLIRHFTYGIEEIHKHFPNVRIKTYASEEPLLDELHATGSHVPWILPCGLEESAHAMGRILRRQGCRSNQLDRTGWVVDPHRSALCGGRPTGTAGKRKPPTISRSTSRMPGTPESRIRSGCVFRMPGGPADHGVADAIDQQDLERILRAGGGQTEDRWRFSQEKSASVLCWGSQALQGIAQSVRRAENRI